MKPWLAAAVAAVGMFTCACESASEPEACVDGDPVPVAIDEIVSAGGLLAADVEGNEYLLLVAPDEEASSAVPDPAQVVAVAEVFGRYDGMTVGEFDQFIVFGFESADDRANASCYLSGATSPWQLSVVAFADTEQ